MVAGLVQRTSGDLTVEGKSISRPGPERGVVFQEPALFPWLSVAENVAFGLRLAAAPEKSEPEIAATVSEYLGLVGLSRFANYTPDELSGGMKQRVAIASCLATHPRVLLMDEPFGALDAQTRNVMQRELLHLHETSGRTTLFVTHDIREAILLSDRVAVMSTRPGRIKEIVDIHLTRPRWGRNTQAEAEFLRLEAYLNELLEHDIREAFGASDS
jgi:ABC-type nitrate/sulfonate/bicarbonate transport system ATPase subunit